jgi:hypothetical protein
MTAAAGRRSIAGSGQYGRPVPKVARTDQRLLDRWWAPGAATLVLLIPVMAIIAIRTDGDLSRLVRAAPPWTDPARALGSLTVLPHEYEFDGQFFYRLGVAPFSTASQVAGITFDIPAYRAGRWGLGATAFLFSAGHAALVPWVLPLINSLCLVALGCLGGWFARDAGRPAMWGLLLPLWPGFADTLTLDTSELLASTLLVAALVASRRRSFGWAGGWLCLSVITRETALVVAIGFVVGGLWERRAGRTTAAATGWGQIIAGSAGVAAFAVNQAVVGSAFGQLPFRAGAGNNIGAPFVGLAEAVVASLSAPTAGNALRLTSMALALWLVVVGAVCLRRSTARPAEKVAWLGSAALFLTLNDNPLVNAPSMMRSATELGLLTVIVMLGARSRLFVPSAVAIALVGAASLGTMMITMPPGP